ncbi:MAG: phosphotransferase [Acidimicrobiales bacterium]
MAPATDLDRRARCSASTVAEIGDVIVKGYAPEGFATELTKATLLHQASIGSSFRAPAVIDADENAHTITYERVDCATDLLATVADANRSPTCLLDLLQQVGVCLGTVHAIAPPVEQAVFGLRSELFNGALARRLEADDGDWRDPAPQLPQVLQHGDYGFTNIFIDSDDRITIIDPSPNAYTSVHPLNVDAPELDLAVLCAHAVGRVASLRALWRVGRHGSAMIDAVLAGYESIGAPVDRQRLRLFTLAGVDAVIAHRSPGSKAHRRLLLGPLSSLLARNLP